MANTSLDSQTFFSLPSAAGGKPTSYSRLPRNGGLPIAPLGSTDIPQRDTHGNRRRFSRLPRVDVVLISSDSASDYGDLDDGQSDTSFPPVDELLPLAKSGTVTDAGERFNPASGSDGGAKEPSATGIANPDTQKPEPPMRVAVQDGYKDPSLAHLHSLEPASSPAPLQSDPSPKNGAENSSGTSPALRNSDTVDSRCIFTPRPSPSEDVDNLHWSGLQRDAGPLETSHGENCQPRENLASLEPADQVDELSSTGPRLDFKPST